jgi:NAD(P)-dependent dehydrogenase (short-subunit alcohol dehydrogenase family)
MKREQSAVATARPAVVVTGASTGIGAAVARLLSKRNFHVFAGLRKETDAAPLLADGAENITPLLLDVTNPQHIAQAVETVTQHVGNAGLLGLVNNAGIAVAGPLEHIPLDDLRLQFDVNFFGQVALAQAFLPLLRNARGRLINVGSVGGRIALPFVGPYAASKFALEAVSDVFRVELAASGVQVAIIEAGAIDTPMWGKSRAAADRLLASLSADALAPYASMVDKVLVRSREMESLASPAEEVADSILHALTAAKPKTRYRVGKHAQAQHFVGRCLPDRLRDFCVRKLLGL